MTDDLVGGGIQEPATEVQKAHFQEMETEPVRTLHCMSSGTAFTPARKRLGSTVVTSPNHPPNLKRLAVNSTLPWLISN